jgi:hypothetical protein
MQHLEAILNAYACDDDIIPDMPQRQPMLRIYFIFIAFITALFVALLPFVLWGAWIGGDWGGFWNVVSFPLRLCPWLGPLLAQALWKSPAPVEGVRAWRQAILAGDDAVAPVASTQPEPWSEDAVHLGPCYVGPLREHRQTRAGHIGLGGKYLLAGAALTAVGAVWTGLALGPLALSVLAWHDVMGLLPLGPSLVLVASCFACLVGGVVLLRRDRRMRGLLVLVATDEGIEWIEWASPRTGYIQQRLAWTQLRGLVRITYRRQTDWTKIHFFLLDAGYRRLIWRADASAEPAEQEASRRLVGLIIRHAGIPLRDASGSVEKLARELLSTKTTQQAKRAAPARSTSEREDARVAMRRTRRPPMPALVGAALAVGILVPLGLALALQSAQPRYYAGIAAPALARQPIYSSALARDDGHWQRKTPSARDPASYAFREGAYYVTGGGPRDDLIAPMDRTYGNAAVEVTVRQQGQAQNNGVGLLLRWQQDARGKNRAVIFQVTPDGEWALWRLDEQASSYNDGWTWLAGGHSAVVHTGVGATNTLLVIMRGPEYLCYVNGQWVGGHLDDTLSSGKAGVYVNVATTTGIFTEFRVYRV